jgi:hypothetical protein
VLQSAEGWIADFHVDGLRLDAIHAVYDTSARPVLREIASRVHARDHRAVVIAESGMNDPAVTRPVSEGGLGHDAAWADDLHHAIRTLLTGDREGYYEEFGDVADLVKCLRRPFLHDGTYSSFRRKRFGAPAGDRPPEQFVVFTQNHDQVGNRAFGDRLPVEVRPLAALVTLLSPFTPMLFQGEEHGETAPFQFFTDHIDEEIAVATREGRRREFAAFAGEEVPDPQDPATFERSKLTRTGEPAGMRELYRDLTPPAGACRRATPTTSPPTRPRAPCASAAGRSSWCATSGTRPCAPPASSWSARATCGARTTASSSARAPESSCSDRLARVAVPSRSDVGRTRHQLLAVLRVRRGRRAVPLRRGRRRDPHPRARAHGVQLALLRPGDPARAPLRLARAWPVRPRARPPLRSVQAADRPLRQGDRGPGALGGRRAGSPVLGRHRPALRLGRRRAAARPVRPDGDLRDARQGLHDAPSRRCARHLRGTYAGLASRARRSPYLQALGVTAVELLPDPPHRRRGPSCTTGG